MRHLVKTDYSLWMEFKFLFIDVYVCVHTVHIFVTSVDVQTLRKCDREYGANRCRMICHASHLVLVW